MMIPIRSAQPDELLVGIYIGYLRSDFGQSIRQFTVGSTTRSIQIRFDEHRRANPDLRPFVVLERGTLLDEHELHARLRHWSVLGTKDWYYTCDAAWREILAFSREKNLGFVLIGEPVLPLFEGQEPPI